MSNCETQPLANNCSTILELEAILHRFTRLANNIGLLPYSGRLAKMKLTTLGERRLRGDLIETFKIVNGLVEYGNGMFRLSRSNKNIIRKASNNNYDSYVSKLRGPGAGGGGSSSKFSRN